MDTIEEMTGMGPDEFVRQHERWLWVRRFVMTQWHGASDAQFGRAVLSAIRDGRPWTS